MQRFDFNSIFGLPLALMCIVIGVLLEGGRISSFVQTASFILVLGGTFGAVMLQTPFKTFWTGLGMLTWVFFPPRYVSHELIEQITEWGTTARKLGLVQLEVNAQDIDLPFMRKGLQLLADGTSADKIKETLDIEINASISVLNLNCALPPPLSNLRRG